jgi:hypothetical protein
MSRGHMTVGTRQASRDWPRTALDIRQLDIGEKGGPVGGLILRRSAKPAACCGAMSQQRTDSGVRPAPQEFLRLVGYRTPDAAKKR